MKIANVLCLTEKAHLLPVTVSADNHLSFEANLPQGLFRATLLMDASAMDWESFNYPLYLFKNQGQNTGPWDFDLIHDNVPLLPAWSLKLNDESLGYVMAQRPSVAQRQNKRLQMLFCFEIEKAGTILFHMEPFTDTNVTALQFRIEPEFEDRPAPLAFSTSPYAQALTEGPLQEWAKKLATTQTGYQPLFEKIVDYARERPSPELLPVLEFSRRFQDDEVAGKVIADQITALVELEHWGNPNPRGYGHDADMGVAAILEPLTFIYHWAPLGPELKARLNAKLQLQMERFYTQLLLWNGFWGGSIMQDHGHRSVSRFGVAAINLLGVVPEANKWLEFAASRMERVLDTLAPDGSIPFSSYHKIQLYMDDMTTWRDAWQHVSGQDVFDRPLFRKIVSFVANRLYEPTREVLCASPRGDRKDFYAGWGFLNAVAEKFGDTDAARLSEILRNSYAGRSMTPRMAATFLTALQHADDTTPLPLHPQSFDYRKDTGLVNYRPRTNLQVALRCAVPGSIHSYYIATGACDRIKDAPLEGHFTVSIADQTLLLTAEGGYRMRSSLGCGLLVDGKGGYGDDDFAMGIPGVVYRGERIEAAWCDAKTNHAYVRVDLTPAYTREAALISYRREFFMEPSRLLCRDVVVSTVEHEYSWNFTTYARRTIQQQGENSYSISERDLGLTLSGHSVGAMLKSSVGDTEVVWAYQNENHDQQFRHIRFFTPQKTASVTAEFSVAWSA